MKKKIKKSRVLWLTRNSHANAPYELYLSEPQKDEDCWWMGTFWDSFCVLEFNKLFPLKIRAGQKKKVKITIEVIE